MEKHLQGRATQEDAEVLDWQDEDPKTGYPPKPPLLSVSGGCYPMCESNLCPLL